MRTVIVGGVAGGATTAARLRRIDEEGEIVIFERGEYISYANCGLPYYIGETISDREALFVQTAEDFFRNHRLQVRTCSEVLRIDREARQVVVRDTTDGTEYREHYDRLVLSPGAEPIKPPIAGIEHEAIFPLRTVAHTDAIKEAIDIGNPKHAVIVGAGFIGLEMAENLHQRGLEVTIVEMSPQVMNPVDYEIAAELHQHLTEHGVQLYLNDGVARFDGNAGGGVALTLQSGRTLTTNMVILSIGVRPESTLARAAGLKIGPTGGILVNHHLQTSDPLIYACGDAIEYPHPITKEPTITYLAGPANKQGRIVADNITSGNTRTYTGSIQTAIAKVFDLTVATTGINEKEAKRIGLSYRAIHTHSGSHAGYYPGAQTVSIKTIFDPTDGRVLGAQAIGYEGVDKRIDLIAALIGREGTIFDLTEIEHSYAPPYSSAKDPVNIAGFVAENVMLGRSAHIHWDELHSTGAFDTQRPDTQLIDVRLPQEFALGSIHGAINIPIPQLRERLAEIDPLRRVVLICGVGQRAYHAERVLRQSGFTNVYTLSGGLKTYNSATEPHGNLTSSRSTTGELSASNAR